MSSSKSTSHFVLQRLIVRDTVKHIHLIYVSCFRTNPDDGPFGPQHSLLVHSVLLHSNRYCVDGGLHHLINQAVTFLTCNGNNLNSAGTPSVVFENSVCVLGSF
jgi:hypothetical protein